MLKNFLTKTLTKIRFWFNSIRNRQTTLSKIQRRIIIAVLIFIIIFCLLFVSKTLYLSLVEEKPLLELLELPELKIEPEPKTIEEILEGLRPPEREVPLTLQEIQEQEQKMKEILERLRPN